VAAIGYTVLTVIVAAFQVALALGAPWGSLAMGGRFPGQLPPSLRVAAVVQAVVLLLLAGVVLARSGLGLFKWSRMSAKAVWVVVAVTAVSAILNLVTPSSGERMLWAPVTIVLFACSLLVATGPEPGRAVGQEAGRVLGLPSGKVRLALAHEAWAAAFQAERARIVAAVGEHLLDIQHVGSTAIPNVPAKPILDILIGVRDFEAATVCVAPLVSLGYTYRGENGIPRRHYFVKGNPRTHHVHMVEIGSDSWRATLRFRDLLRMNQALATEYARGKKRLVRLYSDNRDMYQREKDKIVERILAREP